MPSSLLPPTLPQPTKVLVSFPEGGPIPAGVSLEVEVPAGGRGGWKRRVVADTGPVELAGANFGRDARGQDTCQGLVGVRDPASSELEVHPVSHIFPLRSAVKGYESTVPEGEMSTEAARAKRAELFESFGSRKKKKQLAQNGAWGRGLGQCSKVRVEVESEGKGRG